MDRGDRIVSKSRRVLFLGLLLVASATGSCAYFAGKTVAGKEAPNMLVATDGSICIVSEERFEKTEVGMKALCAWRGGSKIPQPRLKPNERVVGERPAR